jgi:hypothetical protein
MMRDESRRPIWQGKLANLGRNLRPRLNVLPRRHSRLRLKLFLLNLTPVTTERRVAGTRLHPSRQ